MITTFSRLERKSVTGEVTFHRSQSLEADRIPHPWGASFLEAGGPDLRLQAGLQGQFQGTAEGTSSYHRVSVREVAVSNGEVWGPPLARVPPRI